MCPSLRGKRFWGVRELHMGRAKEGEGEIGGRQNIKNRVPRLSLLPNPTETLATRAKCAQDLRV